MRAFLCLFLNSIVLIGCTARFAAVEIAPARVRTFSQILTDRTAWEVAISNESSRNVFCKKIAVRVIYDDPRDYLERGETVEILTDKYFRAHQSITLKGSTSKHPLGKDVHIRSVSAIDPECITATFDEFCSYAEKTPEEREKLHKIAERSGAERCIGLEEKVRRFGDENAPEALVLRDVQSGGPK